MTTRNHKERQLVKIERTRIEIRDDVAIRIYTQLVLDEAVEGGFPNADRLRELAEHSLDAGWVFYQERFADKRIQKENVSVAEIRS